MHESEAVVIFIEKLFLSFVSPCKGLPHHSIGDDMRIPFTILMLLTLIFGFVDHCFASGCLENVARFKPVTASCAEEWASHAVDANFRWHWACTTYAPQWIEVDLEGAFDIVEMRLGVEMTPNGVAHHEVYYYRDGEWELVVDINEYLDDETWLVYPFESPILGVSRVRIETLSSPSWVAWKEIEMYIENPSTVTCDIETSPPWGVLPYDCLFSIGIENLYVGQARRIEYQVDVALAGGLYYTNWRRGYQNVWPGEVYSRSWWQTIPATGNLLGLSYFTLTVRDVTPPPYNLPPYPPSGDTCTDVNSVWGRAN